VLLPLQTSSRITEMQLAVVHRYNRLQYVYVQHALFSQRSNIPANSVFWRSPYYCS
jgi:hypothetical protein